MMTTVNSLWGSATTFLGTMWTNCSELFSTVLEKINNVVLPFFKECFSLSVDTVKNLDKHDWTVLGVGAGLAAVVTSTACACLCKAKG
ncbi:MAG: hypothetical protein KBC64_02935 [Simkaniaceae bacterium]|nr:hypothetical protein [Simkaniaceae bacterium]